MTAAMFAAAEGAVAELALVLLLRRARFAAGGRRVGRHHGNAEMQRATAAA